MLTNLLIVMANGLLVVAATAARWLAAAVGLAIVTQFTRWEIAFDRTLRRGIDATEELL